MKTLKLFLVLTLVAFAMVSVASANYLTGKPKPIRVVSLTIEKAMHNQGLVAAMYAQLDKGDFLHSYHNTIVAEVTYNGTLYRISGTRGQWINFFNLRGDLPLRKIHQETGSN
jgi:hypothetical protein